MRIHKDLEPSHWYTFSRMEQLANVGCDIERAIQWRNAGNMENFHLALERALELLDYTILDPKNKGATRRELGRVRECLKDHYLGDNEYSFTDEFWQQYFFDFNYMAALERER